MTTDILTLAAQAGGALTILTAVAGATAYVTGVRAEVKAQAKQQKLSAESERERTQLAAENQQLTHEVEKLSAVQAQLKEQIVLGEDLGQAALHLKAQVDEKLRTLMQKMGATGGSIYLPVHSPRGDLQGLVFLSIEPFRLETQRLRTKLIPLKSLAGRCLDGGKSFLSANAAADPDHFKPAATLADYRPSTMLNLSLKDAEGQNAGVVQLLSREGEAAFVEDDLARAGAMLGDLPTLVAEIGRVPKILRILGMGQDAAPSIGTVLFFDLSRSSLLFEELPPAIAMQFLNEYFETLCGVALSAGATVENYMGDGALLGFNVPHSLPQHEQAACRAALAMNQAFDELKSSWVAINPRLAGLHHRAGLATGPLVRAVVGHSQSQKLTLLGYPVAVASALCNAAPRDREAVIVSAETWSGLDGKSRGEKLADDRLGKASAFTREAWILGSLDG